MADWDSRFLSLAQLVSTWSKDPSTQTGAVITKGNVVVSLGYNGFPRRVVDDERLLNRDLKYPIIIHCEKNAILFAQRDLSDCTLYTWPFMSCAPCAAFVIQSGITRCIAPRLPLELETRWGDSVSIARNLFIEAGVELVEV